MTCRGRLLENLNFALNLRSKFNPPKGRFKDFHLNTVASLGNVDKLCQTLLSDF